MTTASRLLPGQTFLSHGETLTAFGYPTRISHRGPSLRLAVVTADGYVENRFFYPSQPITLTTAD